MRSFDVAILDKLTEIYIDLGKSDLFDFGKQERIGSIQSLKGSCLRLLPRFDSESFDCLITSPPYCNRYDYTRTYALELAMLGIGEEELREPSTRVDVLHGRKQRQTRSAVALFAGPVSKSNSRF